MSDSLRMYQAIRQRVTNTLQLSEEHRYRLDTLSLMLTGVVRARSVQQSLVAGEVPLRSQDRSFVQRQRRFVQNDAVVVEDYYAPFIWPFPQAHRRHMLPVILDSSPAGRHCQMLMASCGYQGRALPLTWVVRQGQKGHFPATAHLEVLERVARHIPTDAPVVLLGDGEFGHVALAQAAQAHHWQFVFRAGRDDLIWIEGEAHPLAEFQVEPGETLWLEGVRWTQAQFGPVNVAVVWSTKENTTMYLVTSFDLLEETCHWYDRRFWTEPLFRDDKSMGFQLQDSQLRDPDRMARLLLVIALAYLWLLYLGCMAVLAGHIPLIDRADRRDCSLFHYGWRWLRRLLRLDLYIPVRFCPHPFIRLPAVRGVG